MKTLLYLTIVVVAYVLVQSISGSISSEAANVSAIYGTTGECDAMNDGCLPFPSSASFLCQGTGVILDCPQYFNPLWTDTTGLVFYGITNRSNPGRCVKSVDGGGVWGLCSAGTPSPFTGSLDRVGSFAVTSTGALLAAADQGTDNCIIRRSIDGGVSWTTVYTDTTVGDSCGIGFGQSTPNIMQCARSGSYCVVMGMRDSTFLLIAYYSTDNGANWIKGTPFNIFSGDAQYSLAVSADGTRGSLSRGQILYNTANWEFAGMNGGDWSRGGVIPTPSGSGSTGRCQVGQAIFNGQVVLCGPDNTTQTTTFHTFIHVTGLTMNVKNFIPPDGGTGAQGLVFMMTGLAESGNTAYFVGGDPTGASALFIWVTRDNFSSAVRIGVLVPTTTIISGCCRGSMYSWNGKIYFSSGVGGSNAFFGVIQ